MAAYNFDEKIRKNLILTYIFASLCLLSVILGIIFLVVDLPFNDTLSIIFFAIALTSSLVALAFDNLRRRNVKYKQMTMGISDDDEEMQKRREFQAETEAKVRLKMRSDSTIRRLSRNLDD